MKRNKKKETRVVISKGIEEIGNMTFMHSQAPSSLYVRDVEFCRTIFVAKREIVWYSSYIVIRILTKFF